MPDTGAPWNIPYAEPSDLVRDWPALSEDVAEAVAAALPIIQVKTATDTTERTTTSITYVSGSLELAFTPTSATSLLVIEYNGLVTTNRAAGSPTNRTGFVRLVEVSGSMVPGSEKQFGIESVTGTTNTDRRFQPAHLQGFVIAGSTSARTYRVEFKSSSTDISTTLRQFTADDAGRLTITEYAASVL
jgi:hypothetical protein